MLRLCLPPKKKRRKKEGKVKEGRIEKREREKKINGKNESKKIALFFSSNFVSSIVHEFSLLVAACT